MPEWLAAIVAIAAGVLAAGLGAAVLALLLKFLIKLLPGQKKTGMFNPEDWDGLVNEELQHAFEAVAANNTSTNRHKLYELLLETTFCLPSAGSDADSEPAPNTDSDADLGTEVSTDLEESTLPLIASQNEAGQMVLPVFSDPAAMRRWLPNPESMFVMTAEKLFEVAIENDFAEILINPAGPVGGKLARHEFLRLAQGVIPE